jgi:hypothetical protein
MYAARMKSRIAIHVSFIFCLSLNAEIPFEEMAGLWRNTKPEHLEISPLWAFVALKSGLLANLRFFGNYGTVLNPDFPPHPVFSIAEDEKPDFPQDAISAVLEYLFPSPNGADFIINEYAKDPIGAIFLEQRAIVEGKPARARKEGKAAKAKNEKKEEKEEKKEEKRESGSATAQPKAARKATAAQASKMDIPLSGLRKINTLLQEIDAYEAHLKILQRAGAFVAISQLDVDSLHAEFSRKVCMTLKNPEQIREKKKQRSHKESAEDDEVCNNPSAWAKREKRSQTAFDKIRYLFSNLLQKAAAQEVALSSASSQDYPPNILKIALIAFALKAADNSSELYDALPFVLKNSPGTDSFSGERYHAELSTFLSNMRRERNDVSPETIALFLAGYRAYSTQMPELISYAKTTYIEEKTATGGTQRTHEYDDCGETALRNFFNIVWQEHGNIHPARIDEFAERLLGKEPADGKGKKLEEIKQFYKRFQLVSSGFLSAAHAQWSQIVSNLDTGEGDLTPPIYRNGIYNLQSGPKPGEAQPKFRGIKNMLNLLAHLLPDATLNEPWLEKPEEANTQTAKKLTALSTLFSRKGFELNWAVNGVQSIDGDFADVVFSINGVPSFTWQFRPLGFSIVEIPLPGLADWRSGPLHVRGAPWLSAWLSSFQPLKRENPRFFLYARHFYNEDASMPVALFVLENQWRNQAPLVLMMRERIFGMGLYFELMVYGFAEFIDSLHDPNYAAFPKMIRDIKSSIRDSGTYYYEVARENGFPRTVRALLRDGGPEFVRHLLIAACQNGRLEEVRELVENGHAAVSGHKAIDKTPLYVAVVAKHIEIIRYLLSKGADINERGGSGQSTALMGAALINSVEIARILVEHRANVNLSQKWGSTALSEACQKKNVEMVRLLLKHGADIETKAFKPEKLISFAGDMPVITKLIRDAEHGIRPE